MRPSKTILGEKAQEAIYQGVNAIYLPVKETFGPEGKNFILPRTMNRGLRLTNDGYTVAENQVPKNTLVRAAAQMFKESCKKTNERVGDGTTCTTILGGKLFNYIYSTSNEGYSSILGSSVGKKGVMTLKREILAAAEEVKNKILEKAKKVETLEELEKIATISVESEELGKIIAKMAWDCGIDGFIDVVEGFKRKIETEVIKGMRFPAKICGKTFLTDPDKFEMVAYDCPIIITNHKVDNVNDYVPLLRDCGSVTSKVVFVAPSFSDNALKDIAATCKAGYFVYPVKAPSLRTPQFEDLAVYTGSKFINKDEGMLLKTANKSCMGFVEKIIVKDSEVKEDAVVISNRGMNEDNGVEEHIKMLKGQLEETKQEQFKKLLERRIASMASAIGVIRVGAATDTELYYQKLKIEDAVFACKAALRGGYVRGGGICLKEISDDLPEGNILKETLLAPYNQIQNSVDGGIEIGEDVIDPAEAIYYAVEHSTQVVANLITTYGVTAEIEDPIMGEGEYAIATAINELVITDKINKGQLKEGEVEAYRDALGGLNSYEYELINRD